MMIFVTPSYVKPYHATEDLHLRFYAWEFNHVGNFFKLDYDLKGEMT